MLTHKNIICFSNDWRNDPTSKHQIMKVLARHDNTIIWVNSIGLRSPTLGKGDLGRIFSKLKAFSGGIERIGERFYVFTPIVIPFHRFGIIKRINAMILKASLTHYIRKFGMKDIIYWSYLPNVGYILEQLKAERIVYHCVDEWSKFSFIDENIINDEHALCGMSDVVLCSARTLYESRRPYNTNTYYTPHGVDYGFFHDGRSSDLPVPQDLKNVPGPIAGFFGLIHEWVNLELLDFAIRNNPDTSFVFIGKHSVDIAELEKLPNAYFLGQKEYSDLIAYARHFDIGLIPFKINELTVNVNPIKLKEYLALGIPVVSTALPEVGVYANVVRIAENRDDFARFIKEELSGEHLATTEEIDRVAQGETWESKMEEISRLILDSFEKGRIEDPARD